MMPTNVSDITDGLSDTANELTSKAKDQLATMKKKGGKVLDSANNQAQHGLAYLEDEAEVVRQAVSNYVRAKPFESIAFGFVAAYLIKRLLK